MRAALIAVLWLAAGAARAGTPLALSERQVVTLEFDQPVARLAVTNPDVVSLRATGSRVVVTGLRAGRTAVEVAFEDGAAAAFDVVVDPLRRQAAAPAAAGEVVLAVGEERRIRAPAVARVLLEENGVARVSVEGTSVRVVGVSPGSASLVVVDEAGVRTTWSIRVR